MKETQGMKRQMCNVSVQSLNKKMLLHVFWFILTQKHVYLMLPRWLVGLNFKYLKYKEYYFCQLMHLSINLIDKLIKLFIH